MPKIVRKMKVGMSFNTTDDKLQKSHSYSYISYYYYYYYTRLIISWLMIFFFFNIAISDLKY